MERDNTGRKAMVKGPLGKGKGITSTPRPPPNREGGKSINIDGTQGKPWQNRVGKAVGGAETVKKETNYCTGGKKGGSRGRADDSEGHKNQKRGGRKNRGENIPSKEVMDPWGTPRWSACVSQKKRKGRTQQGEGKSRSAVPVSKT